MDSRLVLPVNTVLGGDYRLQRVVGSGGFGITYAAEDINLGTTVAIKEYYPSDFADRDATMSVRPKSDRHKKTFEWGRASFLQEARMLARFRHPSIVQVTRVFEANSTAYMVMMFEQGHDFGTWLKKLDRPPTQAELDHIAGPLLDALAVMHAANFLHRDIAPDNIVIRPDGTPVLLDFGAARRAVAEASRSITGIVKAGYSPPEQYSSDNRQQGPWSDIYALGATFYRAVTGRTPEESTLRIDIDVLAPAVKVAVGTYRLSFLDAIDACLKVKQSERTQSVRELRPILLGQSPGLPRVAETVALGKNPPADESGRGSRRGGRWMAAVAVALVLIAGMYGGLEFKRWGESQSNAAARAKDEGSQRAAEGRGQAALEAERRQRESVAADARRRQIEIEEERRRNEVAEAQRQAELEQARRRKEQAEAAEAEARRKAEAAAEEQRRMAALEEERRRAEAEAEQRRKEETRLAALEETQRAEDMRKQAESARLAAVPSDDERSSYVRRIQQMLKRSRCYDGALTGRSKDAQDGLERFVRQANSKGRKNLGSIELIKANVGDFETWLKEASALKAPACAPTPKPDKPSVEGPKEPVRTRLESQQGCERSCSYHYSYCLSEGGPSDGCARARVACMRTGTHVGPVTGRVYENRCRN